MAVEFSEQAEAKFKDLTGRYPTNLAALLPVLHLAQKEFGWISVEVMDYVAERLDIERSQVFQTATFYTMYDKQPKGKCHIQVCTTLTCAVEGGYGVIDFFEEALGIKVGETTPDGNFTLSEVECLASCGTAPMFQATYAGGGSEYFENLDSDERLQEVLDELSAKLDKIPDPRTMH